jgi:hypothetical protein
VGKCGQLKQRFKEKIMGIYGNLSHVFEWKFCWPSTVKHKQVFKGKSGRLTTRNWMN